MKFAIFDDERLICQELERKLKNLIRVGDKVYVFDHVNETAIGDEHFDVVFMDIQLGNKNGIDVVKLLKQANPLVKTIFVSAYTQYAQDIFEVDPVYFLTKPIEDEKLAIALRKAVVQTKKEEEDYLTIVNKNARYKICIEHIFYIESKGRLLKIHCEHESFETYDKLDLMQKRLPTFFCRSHKSYLLNLNEVKLLEKTAFTLSNGMKVPISQANYKFAKDEFMKFIGDLS